MSNVRFPIACGRAWLPRAGRIGGAVRRAGILGVLMVLVGCSATQHIEQLAADANLVRYVVQAERLPLAYYMPAPGKRAARVVIFLEGDGRPWVRGAHPNSDPTTRDPIALELLRRTPRPAAYLARPCYHGLAAPDCTFEKWTGGRYGQDIVLAMSAAVREIVRRMQAEEAVLVGYSGGGTLAVLIAERTEGITAVVTVAANLDVAAWTTFHGYLPLSQSLNPAASEHAHAWRELHLSGAQDRTIPASLNDAYFERFPHAQRWTLAAHGHRCCWVDEWPALWTEIEARLAADQ